MADYATIKANLLTRIAAAAEELSLSQDGDTNEYVMRRYEELKSLLSVIKELEALDSTVGDAPGPYEILTQGET